MKVRTVLNPRVHLWFPFVNREECEEAIGLRLLTKARYSLPRFKGEQIVILSQVLANEANIGYEDMGNEQATCNDKYLVFEFEDNYLVVLDREAATAASSCILKNYGIPSERSCDLKEPYLDAFGDNNAVNLDFGDAPVSNTEIGFDGLLWA
ncbi:hypothetical protein Cgig2_008101 [Carnegiea gigantea]|uniref:Protease Do-like PDZ domain-containing protein n=1 Tax=Carnegiea gigantea TaxID=171969 RepID=A0A9Q1L0F8_9CARY|nr:hypothetical protein Cgig2_008101 [Carnegiea gigantea]